jgi:hypothetical protein
MKKPITVKFAATTGAIMVLVIVLFNTYSMRQLNNNVDEMINEFEVQMLKTLDDAGY